jgi:hypothetical protein
MSDTRTIQWCPRKTCGRPFTVHTYAKNPNDMQAGKITCPHCGATINRDRNASYGMSKLNPEEEQQLYAENPERTVDYSHKAPLTTRTPRTP